MLPLALRVVWFTLSLLGTLTSWAVMSSFTKAVNSYWSLTYCLGCTIKVLAFCLGIIYKLDPFRMSYNFCFAQLLLTGLGHFLMTGASAVFTFATRYAAAKPKTWVGGEKGLMEWHRVYYFPLLLFPIVAFVLQLALAIRFNVSQHSDDIRCDYGDPVWLRFVSYAGMPWILTGPCFLICIRAIFQIRKTQKHLERSRDPDNDTTLSYPQKRGHVVRSSHTLSDSYLPRSPVLSHASSNTGNFDIIRPDALSVDSLHRSSSPGPDTDLPDSSGSSPFPKFLSLKAVVNVNVDEENADVPPLLKESWRDILGAPEMDRSSVEGAKDSDNVPKFALTKGEDDILKDEIHSEMYTLPARNRVMTQRSRRPLPTLTVTIYRVIAFQFVFTAVQLLSSISPLIDVSTYRPPMVFGTQHIALLISAWAPAAVFFRVPDTWECRSRRLPWKR